jgi:chromosome segregation ATPase
MDLERTMQFILEMQAKLEASAAKHGEQITRHDEQIAKLEASETTLTDLVGRLAQAEIRLVERMDGLAQRMDGLAERMEAGFRQLHEIQATTDYKLNALIDTVDKLVRRNGHTQ